MSATLFFAAAIMDWQTPAAALLVLAALAFLMRPVWRRFRRTTGENKAPTPAGCGNTGGGCGCAVAKPGLAAAKGPSRR